MNFNRFILTFISMSISFYGIDFILELVNITIDKGMLIPVKIVLGIVLIYGIYNLFKIILNKYGRKDNDLSNDGKA